MSHKRDLNKKIAQREMTIPELCKTGVPQHFSLINYPNSPF